jgi:hypothetical protein
VLYVVGATTFLLVRELRRDPPAAVDLGDVATVSSVDGVARRLDLLVEDLNKTALTALKGNDERQREDLKELALRLNGLAEETAKLGDGVRADVADLQKLLLETLNRTGLLREDVGSVRGALDRLVREVRESARPDGAAPPSEESTPPPDVPKRSQAELDRERQVQEHIATLADRRGGEKTNQARYNAAVQLGDLKDPQAVPALIDALQNDPYDLVKRASAWSLGAFGKDAVPAIPALIGEIGGKEEYVGYMCERALGEITKVVTGTSVTFGFDPTMNLANRKKVQKRWEEWWEKNRASIAPDG